MDMELKDYKRFCDEAPVGLYKTLQSDGTFLYINPYGARLLGYEKPEDVIDKVKSTSLYPPELRKKLIDDLHDCGKVSDFEVKITRPDGEVKWITATATNGDDYIIGSLTDITDRKEMMQKLVKDTAKTLSGIAEAAKARAETIAQETLYEPQPRL